MAGDWQLLSHDHFDRDSEPSVDRSGLDLREGLKALWRATLNERVRAGGERGFVSFDLRRGREVIRIPDDFRTLGVLRRWSAGGDGEVAPDAPMLTTLALAHAALYGKGEGAAAVLDIVRRCDGPGACVLALKRVFAQ